MEDADGGFSFDFEGGLDTGPAGSTVAPAAGGQVISTLAAAAVGQSTGGFPSAGIGEGPRRNFRQTVCRHWLRGLCMKGELCGFLHQLDRSRMPICRFFSKYGECHEPDCAYKHTFEDLKECNMYKLGFCPNGPDCRYRHVKLPGPFPPLEESLQKVQYKATAMPNRQNSRYVAQRPGTNGFHDGAPHPRSAADDAKVMQPTGVQMPQQPQELRKQVEEEDQEGEDEEMQLPPPPPLPLSGTLMQQQLSPQGLEQQTELPAVMVNGGQPVQAFPSYSVPLPQGFTRYFVLKSSNRENLELSVVRGLWATHRNNEAKLNEAFDSCDNVIFIFSVNETGHFQGCARMLSKIGVIVGGGGWKYAHGTAHYGRNFRLKWLKLCELSFNKTRHLRNSYKENLPVKISRDCQELEPSVGERLAYLLYQEPDSELMKIARDAELKWEEEKARGSTQDQEDANIIPFEDNDDDDQEEEESDEEDSSSQAAGQNRQPLKLRGGETSDMARKKTRATARGRGGDAFGMGSYDRFMPGSANGFKMPGMATGRGFPPYQSIPRYGGPDLRAGAAMGFGQVEGPVLPSGMVLSGRPPPSGMFAHASAGIMGPPGSALMTGVRPPSGMIAASRPHFIGRPGSMAFRPSQSSSSWGGRRGVNESQHKHKRSESNVGDKMMASGEVRYVEKSHNEQFSGEEVSYAQGKVDPHTSGGFPPDDDDDDSLSEDEAPRRSRHGEGKKRRRD